MEHRTYPKCSGKPDIPQKGKIKRTTFVAYCLPTGPIMTMRLGGRIQNHECPPFLIHPPFSSISLSPPKKAMKSI